VDINNDSRIIKLKEEIQKKKEDFKEAKKFNPITNCILLIDGQTININVCDINMSYHVLVKLNSYLISARDLKIEPAQLEYNGFCITDWITDVRNRLEFLQVKEETKKLKTMEEKLNDLLSEQKKTELEINEIEALLK
jgi:hypothetical protein